VSAHLLNLQGLSATSDYFLTDVTHAVQQDFYVPRCLFVEEGEALQFHDSTVTAAATLQNPYLQAANALAYAQYSRYRAAKSHVNLYLEYVTGSNGRHVEWSDDENDVEEEEEDRRKRLRRERYLWQRETAPPLQKILEDHWAFLSDPRGDPTADDIHESGNLQDEIN
jgi:hypothetical protein